MLLRLAGFDFTHGPADVPDDSGGQMSKYFLLTDSQKKISLMLRQSGAPWELDRELREIRRRARRCNRGRNPQMPLFRRRNGKARRVGRTESQKTCLIVIELRLRGRQPGSLRF
jgi:hypothetical protein